MGEGAVGESNKLFCEIVQWLKTQAMVLKMTFLESYFKIGNFSVSNKN
jgi:hypothetical protein